MPLYLDSIFETVWNRIVKGFAVVKTFKFVRNLKKSKIKHTGQWYETRKKSN